MKTKQYKNYWSKFFFYVFSALLPIILVLAVLYLASNNVTNTLTSNDTKMVNIFNEINNNNIQGTLFSENLINFIRHTEENSTELQDIIYTLRVSKQRFWINLDMIPLDKMDLYIKKLNIKINEEHEDYARYFLDVFLKNDYPLDYLLSNIHWYVYNILGLLISPSTVLEVLFYKSSFIFFPFMLMFFILLIVSFTQPYLGLKNIAILSAIAIIICLFALSLLAQLITKEGYIYTLDIFIHPIYLKTLNLSFSFCVDIVGFAFAILILFISLSAVIYTCVYLYGDQNASDFLVKLLWFSFSMLSLVLSRNIANFYLSWEFIGITSAWLINFNSNRLDTLKSALKAFTFNKLSDLCIISGLLICYYEFGSANFQDWNLIYNLKNISNIATDIQNLTAAAALFILAASIKSAQIGFHVWLPDSMDAPVPASALIHSATLVSAGVYVLIRFYTLIDLTGLSNLVGVLGAITGAYGGIVAGLQTDLKKALAYSTISHCGFLFVLASLNDLGSVLTYLILHGSFKALSFICAGEAVRSFYGYQDINRMGGLFFYSPSITSQLSLAMANLCGFPFFLGYMFKAKFQLSMMASSTLNPITEVFCCIGLASSILYFSKVFYAVAFSFKKHSFKNAPIQLKTSKFHSIIPLKSPVALIFIFWFMYTMSLFCVNIFLPQYLVNITSNTSFISDFTHNSINLPTQSLQSQTIQNYYYFFYSVFLVTAFYVLNIYPIYSVKTVFYNNKIASVISFVLLVFIMI